MPHIIVEYSKNIGDIIGISKLLVDLHDSLAEAGVERARIKTRGIQCDDVVVGDHGSHGHMIHTTLLLLEGRDLETKNKYSDALRRKIIERVKGKVENCAVTLEIRDMNKDTYYM